MKKSENYNEYKIKILNNIALNEKEKENIENTINSIDEQIKRLNKEKMQFQQLIDYNNLKEKGFSNDKICEFWKEDEKFIDETEQFVEQYLKYKNTMFGYPANMLHRSGTTEYLRYLESKMYLINNCGDPNETGNYKMDSKKVELKIIDMVKDNLKLPKDDYFGYITSGGTEGNFWGIREGFSRFKNGVLYFSDESHYSIEKFVKFGTISKLDNYKIETIDDGRINVKKLLIIIKQNWYEKGQPAILALTWGTTKTGAIDDIKTIQKELKKEKIPYYLHIDAALYGGIPKNQINAPIISDFNIDFDSIAISLHKYIGSSKVNGVVIAKKKTNHNFIDYIGQEDTTYLGSRDSHNFSVYQQMRELYYRSKIDEYEENIFYTENLLKNKKVKYSKCENSNTFVLEKASDVICAKYQLSAFENKGKKLMHIIIFPYHKKEYINGLISEIADSLKANKSM